MLAKSGIRTPKRDDPISSVAGSEIVALRRPIADVEPSFPIQVQSDLQKGIEGKILSSRVFPS
jgi:hypothetical protein